MQNLMIGHASITTFLKHYLSRRNTVDTQAVVQGIQPQAALMRAACTMSRSIDYRWPQQLTEEQSASVDDDPSVCSLLNQQEQLKRTVTNATKHPKYRALASKLSQERQRQRHALLWDIKERWEFEQPDNPELVHNVMLPAQGELANLVMSKPGTTIEEEMDRRNRAIWGQSRNAAPPVKSQLECKEEALEAAKVLVYKEKRPKRIRPFGTPGNLSKHFERKHLKHIESGKGLSCNLCKVPLLDKMHLQQHAQEIHRTVSPRHSVNGTKLRT
ncbi:hypothetical protein EJ02DRAFT_471417 [Clathrospora elynae]|uniref:C2H2-type domain-containing protein n=1 Tax=Clathrospora elynae TaxID=706981 RepID=A0A6A5S5C7_9PLEO|nr:hypothetical protein EJ02DRAFT_471417 [Clathrospora elynae]